MLTGSGQAEKGFWRARFISTKGCEVFYLKQVETSVRTSLPGITVRLFAGDFDRAGPG
jgi:hypothetical protein